VGDQDPDLAPASIDLLVGATLYLMSCHADQASPRVAGMVAGHLDRIARHPHTGRLTREWAVALLPQWRSLERNCAVSDRASSV